MILTAATARARRIGPGEPVGAMHQGTLERAFGRIFSVFAALILAASWLSSITLAEQRPGTAAADLLLSALVIWQALRALRRPPSQRDLCLLAAATAALLLVSRAPPVSGGPFADEMAYGLVAPVAAAWAVWSARFVVPVPVLLVVLATGAWNPGGGLPVEHAVGVLAIVACTSWAARVMRSGARRADADADALSQRMAAQDAALAAEEAERRAANVVHDDVLAVLRAISTADRQLPWSLVVAKAQGAQEALARQLLRGGYGTADLGSALRWHASQVAAELDVRCDINFDIDIPPSAIEALSAAAGEALRNVAAHAGVHSAMVTARGTQSGGVTVTVSDDGLGFDPTRVGPASTGLRNSVRARLSDAGGRAEILSAPGQGTSVVLTWNPPRPTDARDTDPLDWVRRMVPSPGLIFVGFMLPFFLHGLVSLGLSWQDMRWQPAAVVVYLGLLGVAIPCARYLSRIRMTRSAAVRLTAANTILAAVGALAIAPGTTDSHVYWVATGSGVLIAVLCFIRGPASGLTALALDVAALTVGLLVTGRAISPGEWVSTLAVPAVGAGLAVGIRAAFRGLSRYTESQLAEHREHLRLRARAEAISRVDGATLDNARRVAEPVLSMVTSSQAPDAALRTAAALANATLRDELLAPGFLTADLAQHVRAARAAGARITIDFARQGDAALAETARALLAAALIDLDADGEVALLAHPPAEGYPALLILRLCGSRSGHAALRRSANECGALVSDLGDRELLVRLRPAAEDKVQAVRDLEADGRNVLVAGDGADDAPALATVGIGAAMDRARSDQTLDTTDIVIMPPTRPPSCRYPGRNRAVAAHRPRDHRGPGQLGFGRAPAAPVRRPWATRAPPDQPGQKQLTVADVGLTTITPTPPPSVAPHGTRQATACYLQPIYGRESSTLNDILRAE
jgi:signal transduction histidine kinase